MVGYLIVAAVCAGICFGIGALYASVSNPMNAGEKKVFAFWLLMGFAGLIWPVGYPLVILYGLYCAARYLIGQFKETFLKPLEDPRGPEQERYNRDTGMYETVPRDAWIAPHENVWQTFRRNFKELKE